MAQRPPRQAGPAVHWVQAARVVLVSPLGIAFFTVLCLVASHFRRAAEVEPAYGFYRWNLFLALVPLALAYAISWGRAGASPGPPCR